MAVDAQSFTSGLSSFIKSLKNHPADAAIDQLVLLLRRRQIRGSRPCAVAATHLYLRVISKSKFKSSKELLERVRAIGVRLQAASPTELVLGNVTRRVLGLIREINETPTDENESGEGVVAGRPPLPKSTTSHALDISLDRSTTGNGSLPDTPSIRDVKEDVLNGLREMLDELDQADEQVAGYALEHVHANETILTYTSSLTVQKFLLNAAKKRKFTVIHAEGYPNEHEPTFDTVVNGRIRKDNVEADSQTRLKPLIAAGVTVILIPDSAVFAVMSQVTKVLLPMHIGFPNGGFVGAAGCSTIARAAKAHKVPVVALGAIYKLSPLHPYEPDEFTELGDPGRVLNYADGELASQVEVVNPVSEYVEPELVDLFITNIGGFAPGFLYRVVADHYRAEDVALEAS